MKTSFVKRHLIALLTVSFWLTSFAYTVAQTAKVQDPAATREPDVMFVPTPQAVVDKMLELAEVKHGDVVYDLGCGDGRIVVTAAKKYGVKAVGFDIDPKRIKEARANVKANGVEHLVTIRQADIFTLDLREATVVTLYLLPKLNVRLMPQLEKLKPGSRIVSHEFDMSGAKPATVYRMSEDEFPIDEDEYEGFYEPPTLYKWTVPWEKESPEYANDVHSNWHQWRGPNADGTSTTAEPPLEWGPDKNVRWKAEVPGRGVSTPIIWKDRVFLLTAIQTERKKAEVPAAEPAAVQPQPPQPDRARGQQGGGQRGRSGSGRFRGFGGPPPTDYYQFVVLCYNRENGEEIWRKVAAEEVPHEAGHSTNTFASFSPVTDGKSLYVYFGSRGIFSFDLDGNRQWARDLGQMQTRAGFGEGSSPSLHGDTLVVPWDHEGQSSVLALDAKSGETKWKADREERTTWATPFIVEHNGRTQVVTNGSRVRSYDLKTGELIWECGGQVDNPIPSPVRQDNVVFCMTGYRGNAIYAIPLDAAGDITGTDNVAWHRNDAAPYVPSPTLYKGQLYFTKSRDGIVSSLDAKTGEVLIGQTRLPGVSSVYASPVAAADRIYFTGRDGTTVVLKHGSTMEVLATNSLGEGIDASPAMVQDELFLRSEKHLYCIANR